MRKALVVIVWRPEIVSAEKKVLLLRLIPRRGGFWQPVTGKVENDESYAEGALREAQEETGLRFERQPQFLGLEHEFPGRDGYTIRERSFYLPVLGGTAPPLPKLDGKEHDGFAWMDLSDAVARVKYPGNRQAIERAAAGSPPLTLSKRGTFFQDGEEITHIRTAELLQRSLQKTSGGLFTVNIGGEELEVILEDNPLVVRSYDRESGKMKLSNFEEEVLRPETLIVRPDHSFVCTASNGWPATFSTAAYYELSKDVSEGSVAGEYVLHFLGRDHRLRVAH